MNQTWDLSILYTGFDDPAFAADLALLGANIQDLHTLSAEAEGLDASTLIHRYIDAESALATTSEKLGIYTSLRFSGNTADGEAASMQGRLMGMLSACAADNARLSRLIAGVEDLEGLIASDESLAEYAFMLRSMKEESRYLLSDKEEALLSKLDISGAGAWSDLQSSLTSSVKADYRGEKITLPAVRNLAYEADASVRKDAYDAELACYAPIRDSVAFALNSIKHQVITECELRGYASPLDQALVNSRMKKETLDALLSAMDEYLPAFHKYLKAKAKYLGHKGSLPWWDMFAPIGKNDKKFTPEEARDYLLHIFGGFDKQLHDMVETAFNHAWIDFFPREGKVGGAFDCGVPSAHQSRVLTNFDGSFSDVVTLAHELGHAFHDQQVFDHSPLTQGYSMPVAETASTFNEVLVVSSAIAQAEDVETRLSLIESQLSDATQIICDIYSRYLFEASVFENRPNEFMSADRMCELMHEAQVKAYGDGLDEATLHPYMWLCKGHYYSGGLSFYNFPYAFGGLFARGLYAKYVAEGPAFVPTYKKMLNATSVTTVEDCAGIAGIDLTEKSFWEAGLQSLADEIQEFCALVEA